MNSLGEIDLKAQKEKRTDTLIWVLRGLISATFLFSGFSKLYPHIEVFEHDLVIKGITNWTGAHYLSRALISFELFIGIAFLQNHYFRKIIVPASFLLLAAFSVYLSYSLYLDGNKGNCGCFGQVLPMTPLEALIKNIVLMGLVAYIYIKTEVSGPHWHIPVMLLEAIGFLILLLSPIPLQSISQPFTPVNISRNAEVNTAPTASSNVTNAAPSINSNPVATQPTSSIKLFQKSSTSNLPQSNSSKQSATGNQQSTTPQQAKTSSPFAKYTTFSDKKTTDLDNGIKLIALFDPDCEHCMKAATKIANLRKSGLSLPPMYILFLEGNEDKIPNFFNVTGLNEPYMVIGAIDFFQFLKNSPPRVVLLNNGAIAGDWESEDFDESNFKATVEKAK